MRFHKRSHFTMADHLQFEQEIATEILDQPEGLFQCHKCKDQKIFETMLQWIKHRKSHFDLDMEKLEDSKYEETLQEIYREMEKFPWKTIIFKLSSC